MSDSLDETDDDSEAAHGNSHGVHEKGVVALLSTLAGHSCGPESYAPTSP